MKVLEFSAHLSALWVLMPWWCSTRAWVATVLNTHPCVSRCLWVKVKETFNPLRVALSEKLENIFGLANISQRWNGIYIHLFETEYTIAAEDLVTQWARASTAMILASFSRHISVLPLWPILRSHGVNQSLAKPPLQFKSRLAKLVFTSVVKYRPREA